VLLERVPQQEHSTSADPSILQGAASVHPKRVEDHPQLPPLAAPTLSGGRLIALAVALLAVTLGMVLSLLFLSSTRDTMRPESLESLLAPILHLPFIRLLLTTSLATLGSTIVAFAGLAFYIVNALIRPKKSDSFIPLTPFALGIPAEEVQFPPRFGAHQVSGLFIPNSAAATTIIVCPGYRRTYKDVLGMCKHLWLDDHNVLVFEFYGHGTPTYVPVTLGYREINDFLGAVEYAKQRAPQTRVGALGYSMGGAVSIMGAARTHEVEAVVADSAFATHWSAVETAVHRTLRFSAHFPAWTLRVLYWLTDHILWMRAGYHLHQVEPVRDIKLIAPRPVLLIHGLKDTIVSPGDAQLLYQAAEKPKALWLVPETEHIKAYFSDSAAYVTRVTDFFARHLKGSKQEATTVREEAPQSTASGKHHSVLAHNREEQTALKTEQLQPTGAVQKSTRKTGTMGQHAALGEAYGRLVYRFRWPIIAFWACIILASVPFASRISMVLHNSGYAISSSESNAVDVQLVSTLHRPATQVLVVFQSNGVAATDPTYQREVGDFITRAKEFPHVTTMTQGGAGRDGRSTFVAVGLDQDKDTVAERLPSFRTLLPHAGPAHAYLTGDVAAANEIQLDTQSDTEFAEALAMPLTLLVLLVVFGSVVAGVMPLLLAGAAVPTALAAIYAIALSINTNIFIQSVTSIIGLGLSIDYSLFIVRRFREELAQGHSVQEAVTITLRTAGEAILFSGLTVAIGFTGLLFIGITIMTSFGIGGVITASASVLSALTLLPALLSVVGRRINALRIPLLSGDKPASARPSFWRRFTIIIMRKPVLIVTLVSITLLLLGFPARTLNPGDPGTTSLPAGSEARVGLDILHAQFPSVNDDPIYVLVRTQNGSNMLTAPNRGRRDRLSRWLAAQAHITDVESLTRMPQTSGTALGIGRRTQLYSTGAYRQNASLLALVRSTTVGDTTLIVLRTDTQAGTGADQALIDHLRSINPGIKQGLITQIGGDRVINLDFNRTLYNNFMRALAFILLATYILLLLTFRSILLPLKAILMNVLSISASYGVLVFIFQEGHFQQVLGFTADGTIDRFIPILLFCILFGLSMDYEVFLLARAREEWLRTGDNRASVALGLEKTGGVITNAALLFVIVSSAFLATSLIVTKELGLGITVSILVDASIIRCMLVPASMQLMGRWNWWVPKWARRRSVSHPEDAQRVSLLSDVATAEMQTIPVPSKKKRESKRSIDQRVVAEQILQQLFAQALDLPPDSLQTTSDFFQLGGDSDSLNTLLSAIESTFCMRLAPNDIFNNPVIFRLAARVVQAI
jgi:putative drug exporter of the RND superfamily